MEKSGTNLNNEELTKAYDYMESLPGRFKRIIEEYVSAQQEARDNYNNDQKQENEKYASVLNNLRSKFDGDIKLLDDAHAKVLSQIKETTEKMDHAVQEYRSRDFKVKTYERSLDSALAKVYRAISGSKDRNVSRFDKRIKELVNQENEIYNKNNKQISYDFNSRLKDESVRHAGVINQLETGYDQLTEQIDINMSQSISNLNIPMIRENYEVLRSVVPKSQNFAGAKEMPETIEIGYCKINLEDYNKNEYSERIISTIQDNFGFALSEEDQKQILLPCGRSFRDPYFNKLILYDAMSRGSAIEYLRALEMRMFMTIPCGKFRVTMLDPIDLGSNFSMFSSLGDQDERIISTKIWSDPSRIKEQLRSLILQIEHVNQDCLRNDYEDIVVYNRHVGKNAEPLQALFVADFPRHFDKESCDLLEKVISSGPKCGVYTFIAADKNEIQINREAYGLDGILRAMEVMDSSGNRIVYTKGNDELELMPIFLPEKADQDNILTAISTGIKNNDRITIYFDEISDDLTKHEEKWFNYSEDNGIDIPIGLEGASRTVQIHLGGQSVTSHHALISGNPGAGKSVLLHTIIMSTLLRYSPKDVQIFFLDFKRGVESKIYADADLQNFRVISLDTEPEFGLAVLKYLDEEQAIRSQEFHDENIQEIEQYNEMAEYSNGQIEKFPRILLIIDEFHEMFRNNESDISKECASLLERIVKQGRAFGIHVILASQVLPENLRNIYSLIMNRIALQSTEQTAQCILDSDNDGIRSLGKDDSGKGIFNDGGGNRDNNHLFRVAYFSEEEQREVLERIKVRQDRIYGDLGYEKTRLLLSSIQDNNENPLNYFVNTGKFMDDPRLGCPLYLGEEIAMVNTFDIRLMRRRCQNLLIAGSQFGKANAIYSFVALSIIYNYVRLSGNHQLPDEPIITFIDFAKSPSRGMRRNRETLDVMNELYSSFPDLIRIFGRDSLQDGITILSEELTISNPARQHYVIFAGINRAKRMLDSGNAYERPLKQLFCELIKNGPEAGINTIVWANEPSSFLNYYGEILPEFDYRMVYDLKENEFEQFVSGGYMDTSYDNNVVSYNPDDENKKIRIYSKPLVSWTRQFIERIKDLSRSDVFCEEYRKTTDPVAYTTDDVHDYDMDYDSDFGGEFDDEFED